MKKVLIISTSLRKNSNSQYLAKEFERGVKDVGNQVEFISLSDKNIGFCHGCLVCQKTQKCVIQDDAINIAEKVKNADILVFATPIYYYEMCGQMKTFFRLIINFVIFICSQQQRTTMTVQWMAQ